MTTAQENDYVELVQSFPVAFYLDIYEPWLIYLVGRKHQLFDRSECVQIQSIYAKFPQVWEVIEPNFNGYEFAELRSHVKAFIESLKRFPWLPEVSGAIEPTQSISGLGLAPLVIAGLVLAASALGIGGAIYGIGYWKEQNNQAELIREVVQGHIPPDILREDVQAENASILGSIGNIAQWIVIGGLILVGWNIWKSVHGS